MKRSMISLFALAGALSLGGLACDDEESSNADAAATLDGGAGLGGGGTGGTVRFDAGAGTGGSTAGTSGTTDGGAGTGGTKADGGLDAGGGTKADGGADAGSKPAWAVTCTTATTMVAPSATDFCDYYDDTCSAEYGSGGTRFSNRAECLVRFAGYSASEKRCTSYHLCVAGTSAMAAMQHCRHPAGGDGNPCNLN